METAVLMLLNRVQQRLKRQTLNSPAQLQILGRMVFIIHSKKLLRKAIYIKAYTPIIMRSIIQQMAVQIQMLMV